MQNRPTVWNGVQVPYGATVEELADLVNGPIPARWAAFVALAHTSGEPALAVLGASAESPDPHVRRIAVEAIGIHPEGNRLDAILCRVLSDAHGAVVRSACEAAAAKHVTASHDSILGLIDAREESTRVVSLRALRTLWSVRPKRFETSVDPALHQILDSPLRSSNINHQRDSRRRGAS